MLLVTHQLKRKNHCQMHCRRLKENCTQNYVEVQLRKSLLYIFFGKLLKNFIEKFHFGLSVSLFTSKRWHQIRQRLSYFIAFDVIGVKIVIFHSFSLIKKRKKSTEIFTLLIGFQIFIIAGSVLDIDKIYCHVCESLLYFHARNISKGMPRHIKAVA